MSLKFKDQGYFNWAQIGQWPPPCKNDENILLIYLTFQSILINFYFWWKIKKIILKNGPFINSPDRSVRTWFNCPSYYMVGQMSSWTNVRLDKCLGCTEVLLDKCLVGPMSGLDKCPVWQMSGWTIVWLNDCPVGQTWVGQKSVGRT